MKRSARSSRDKYAERVEDERQETAMLEDMYGGGSSDTTIRQPTDAALAESVQQAQDAEPGIAAGQIRSSVEHGWGDARWGGRRPGRAAAGRPRRARGAGYPGRAQPGAPQRQLKLARRLQGVRLYPADGRSWGGCCSVSWCSGGHARACPTVCSPAGQ